MSGGLSVQSMREKVVKRSQRMFRLARWVLHGICMDRVGEDGWQSLHDPKAD